MDTTLQCVNTTNQSIINGYVKIEHVSYAEGTWIILLVAVFTIFLAVLFNILQRKIDKQNDMDLAFDAGGKVSIGLTATTIVSQWTWAATLLQSSAVGSKYGISGPFWYAAGATIQILLFAVVSVKLKMHAPGAKTFLQVIRCRFGCRAHKVFVAYALLTNVVVTGMLMLGGSAVLKSIVEGYSIEMATFMCALIIGGYTQIGGLGATFYASYFNTVMIFVGILVFCWKIFFSGESQDFALGSVEKLFNLISQADGPEKNFQGSYLTMLSQGGLGFGVINIVGNFGTVFVDQSYWQSSVAAKPKEGVYGFLAGGLVWFAVPFTFATTMGLAYIALGVHEGHPLLTDSDVSAGLLPVAVASRCAGHGYLLILLGMILMAVTSTGSAEVVAVASILVYDIHMVYVKPFRAVTNWKVCDLCGSHKKLGTHLAQCKCISMNSCRFCKRDNLERNLIKRGMEPVYCCPNHGPYRLYRDFTKHRKTLYMLVSAIGTVPVAIVLQAFGFTLGWVYLFMGVLIGSAVIPVTLAITWKRATAQGIILGPLFGTFCGIVMWLLVSCTYPGGLGDFLKNTGQELSMLVGNLVSVLVGGLTSIVVSWCTVSKLSSEEISETWDKTLDIDNPLYPWTDLYQKELNLKPSTGLTRPTLATVKKAFRGAYLVALVASSLLTLILIIIWPAVAALLGVFGQASFYTWVSLSFVWAVVAAVYITTVPIWSEIGWRIAKMRRSEVGVSDSILVH